MQRRDARSFAAWLQAQLELRGLVGVIDAARALDLEQSTLSRWLGGSRVPQRRGVIALARGLGLPAEEVQAAADADPGRVDLDNPPPPVVVQLDDIRRLLGALTAQMDAGPLPVAQSGPPLATRMLEASGPFPDAAGPMEPVIVRAPHPLPLAHGGDRAVAWIVATTAPQPGWWVHVGHEDPPNPRDIKLWQDGDAVTGVVAIVQVVPRARRG